MTHTENKSRCMLIASMCIFGTIGVLRRYIPLSSSLIALVRGTIGTVFLILIIRMQRIKPDFKAIRRNLPLLLCSGAAIGFNWILLFEAYNHTSVATATLCYYLAPILVILAAPIILKERLTIRKLLCAIAALTGMIPVSGVLQTGISASSEWIGILYGIGAAVLYACVILMNKRITGIASFDKTVIQLGAASFALLPYVLLTENWLQITVTPLSVILLLVAGVLHTGLAYWLYFGSMDNLKSHTVALYSYIDPILAILLSVMLLNEPMHFSSAVGAAMILGAAYISEK